MVITDIENLQYLHLQFYKIWEKIAYIWPVLQQDPWIKLDKLSWLSLLIIENATLNRRNILFGMLSPHLMTLSLIQCQFWDSRDLLRIFPTLRKLMVICSSSVIQTRHAIMGESSVMLPSLQIVISDSGNVGIDQFWGSLPLNVTVIDIWDMIKTHRWADIELED
jgi:hypothetical protein